MLDRKWAARCAALTVAAALTAVALRGQSRQPDYNFFDSRTFAEAPPLEAARAALRSTEFAADATMVPHRWGGAAAQIYRLGGVLTPPSNAEAETVARAFLTEQRDLLGLAGTTVFSLPLERRYESAAAGLTHLVFRQQYAGIAVFGGEIGRASCRERV